MEIVFKSENYQVVGTKWIVKNKLDENGAITIRNKAILYVKDYNQEEEIVEKLYF